MKLGGLAEAAGLAASSNGDATVTGFAIDHRKVAPGTVFGAFQGMRVNGEDFIPAAIAAGAVAIVARLDSDRAVAERLQRTLVTLLGSDQAVFNSSSHRAEGPAAGNNLGAELRTALAQTSLVVLLYTTDEGGSATSWNVGAERLFGFTYAEMVGHSGDVIFTSADRAAGVPDAERRKARAAGRALDERWHQRKDGSRFPALVSTTALRDVQDEIIGYLLIGTDNTARKQAEEALLKAGDTDLASGLRFERHAFTLLAGTADRDEGIRAFQEKRQARFQGR